MQFSTLISLLKVGSWNPGKIFKRGYTPIIPKFLINQNVYVQLKLTIFSVLWVLWENRNRSNRTKTLLEFYFFLGIFFFFLIFVPLLKSELNIILRLLEQGGDVQNEWRLPQDFCDLWIPTPLQLFPHSMSQGRWTINHDSSSSPCHLTQQCFTIVCTSHMLWD